MKKKKTEADLMVTRVNLWFIRVMYWVAVKCIGQFEANDRMSHWMEHLCRDRGYTVSEVDVLKRKLRDRGIDFTEGQRG